MRKGKLPQYIVNAIRRRARVSMQWHVANEQIRDYCKQHGIEQNDNNDGICLYGFSDPDFFICNLEECLQQKAQKGVST